MKWDGIEPACAASARTAQARLDDLTKPLGSLDGLEVVARRVVALRRGDAAPIARPCVIVMAADHGVCAEGVSAYPPAVTPQMVANFLRGGAAINVLARAAGAEVVVVDMGVAGEISAHPDLVVRSLGKGTGNIARGPAMTRAAARRAVEIGFDIACERIDAGCDLLATGDMGIGNTTASAAITSAATGISPEVATGRGTGVDDAGLARKRAAVRRALELHRPDPADGLGLLASVGGFEIGGLAGVILGAASRRVPVVIDGFISGAAALVAHALAPAARDAMIAAHESAEPGHAAALAHLGLSPLLRLNLRLGEGTGAALAIPLVAASLRLMNEMATFSSAGVSGKNA